MKAITSLCNFGITFKNRNYAVKQAPACPRLFLISILSMLLAECPMGPEVFTLKQCSKQDHKA